MIGGFYTENIVKKKNGQVLNKPQMRLLLKNPEATLFANPDRSINYGIHIWDVGKTPPNSGLTVTVSVNALFLHSLSLVSSNEKSC